MTTVIRRQQNIDRVLMTAFTDNGRPAGEDHKLYLAEIGLLMAAEHDWLYRRTHRVVTTMLAHAFLVRTDPPPNVVTHGHIYVTLGARGRSRIRELTSRQSAVEGTGIAGDATTSPHGATREA